jgi:hypothetical protein
LSFCHGLVKSCEHRSNKFPECSFQGKAEAEKSVVQEFGENSSLIIKPAIIAGGPPGEIRPPGPPGVKPVDVEAVAKAIVAGVEGNLIGEIDGNDAITAL